MMQVRGEKGEERDRIRIGTKWEKKKLMEGERKEAKKGRVKIIEKKEVRKK